jgi:hypothetical protein
MVLTRAIPFRRNFILDLYLMTLLVSDYKKQVATIWVVFDLVCSWTLVENIVAKGRVSTSELPSSIGQLNTLQIFIYKSFPIWKQCERNTRLLANWMHSKSFICQGVQLEIPTFTYWPIEYIPKASFVKVFQFQKIIFIYWSLNAFKNLELCECFNL